MWRGKEINTRLIPGHTAGHRSPASSVRLTELDLEERARLQVLPFNKVTSIISPPAVIGNINCVVCTYLLSPNTDTETNYLRNKNISKSFTSLSAIVARPTAALCYQD